MATETHKTPTSFVSPDSSNIARASYDVDKQTLTVVFRPKVAGDKERQYQYECVPLALWLEFEREALSKGKFFANCIKPYYPAKAV